MLKVLSRSSISMSRRAFVLGGATLVAGLSALHPARAATQAGSVADITGEAFAEAERQRRKLAASNPIHLGEKVETAAKSTVGLRLEHGLGVRLGGEGVVTVDSLTDEGGGKLSLNAGPLLLDRSAPAAKRTNAGREDPSLLRVETPYGVITVGGDTRAFIGPSREVYGVFVDRGSVTVVAGGQRVRLKQGEGTDIRTMSSRPTPPARWKSERIRDALDSVRAAPREDRS
jgi:hypothetical protein